MRGSGYAVALAALVNGVVLFDAWVHDPHVGYDAWDHLRYVETLSEGRLPLPSDTREFFSPPAPYALPALARSLGVAFPHTAKLAQLQNVLWSVGLTVALLRMARRLRPESPRFAFTALALLGTLPVYYKSFVQVRGEPLLAFLAVASVYCALELFLDPRWRWRSVLLAALPLAGAALARQWGVLLYPAVGLFAGVLARRRLRPRRIVLGKLAAVAALVALLGGWFYARHQRLFGSPATFNREAGADAGAQPASFYLGLGDGELFSAPVRENFPNQLWPILHSEVWGDYWSYFTARQMPLKPLHAGRAHPSSNLETMAPYLGRVNALALLPALVYAVALLTGAGRVWELLRIPAADAALPRTAGLALVWLSAACTVAGYAWFLISYPDPERGNTVKATYVLQLFPFAALLAADWLERLRRRWRAGYVALVAGLLGVAAHNVPALFTRYPGAAADVPLRVDDRWREPVPRDLLSGRPGGIAVEYFRGEGLGDPVAARTESGIDLRTLAAAVPGAGADRFSARWRGWLFFPADGRNLLCEESDDGVRLRFDGELLIDDWSPHAHRRVCEPVRVRAGWYPLEIEYYDREGAAVLRVLRGADRRSLHLVPPGHLCCRLPEGGGSGP